MPKDLPPQKPKKSMAMRIFILVMCIAMLAGFIILPLLPR